MKNQGKPNVYRCEADVAEGLEDIARGEIQTRLGRRVTIQRLPSQASPAGRVQFTYSGDLRAMTRLKTIQAVYLVRRFDVPRPKALLGDEHLRALLLLVHAALSLHAPGAYRTLYVSAAGSESSVMTRLKAELSRHTGLIPGGEEGDLMIRIRRAAIFPNPMPLSGAGSDGWEVLVRLTPRPLATRSWRVCNYQGALNAAVAHAMIALTQPKSGDTFLNIACGSGTLLAERLDSGPIGFALGCDLDPAALDCAGANVSAFSSTAPVSLLLCDAQALPLPDRSVDALCADLPFGHLVGSHAENLDLYPAVLAEAARVARPGARFALITHEIKLMESLIGADSTPLPGPAPRAWSVEQARRVELGGLHPRIFVLRRK